MTKSRFVVFSGVALYIALLNLVYIKVLSPHFSYLGYTYYPQGIDLPFFVLACLLSLVPSLWLPTSVKRPSQVVFWLLYVMVFVPSCFIPLYTLRTDPGQMYTFNLALLGAFVLLGLMNHLPLLRLPRFQLRSTWYWSAILALSLVFYALIFQRFGFRINIVALADVYDLRSGFKDALAAGGGVLGYVIPWQINILNPLLIAHGFLDRKLASLVLGVVGQLYIFSITGFKSALFSGVLIVLLIIAFRNEGKVFGLMVPWGSVALVSFTTVVYWVSGSFVLVSLFVRRLIVTNGLLTGYYVDFFSQNPQAFLGHSVLKHAVDYPYVLAPPQLIGHAFFGTANMSANANIWADAFANFGYPGLVCFTFLLGLVLWLFDSLSQERDLRLPSLMLGVPALNLSNSAFFTVMLTQGLGLALLLMYFMPCTGQQKAARARKGQPFDEEN